MTEQLEPDELDTCPICALRDRNQIHGVPRETPFTGTMAHAMFLQAVEHLGAHAPKWAQKVAKMPKAKAGTQQNKGGGWSATIDASNP